ncbi:MAG: hypothetical protein D6726_07410 [Nitrospirae bacterium]|nr:MAG: hypothetical protein D6726_07410 [Nitrospirota bacterium]
MSKRDERLRKKIIWELRIKARFLSYIGLFGVITFSVLIIKLLPQWPHSKLYVYGAVLMEIFSFVFFIYTRRILAGLNASPSDKDLARFADFLSLYYYPSFLFRKKKNPYIVPDEDVND